MPNIETNTHLVFKSFYYMTGVPKTPLILSLQILASDLASQQLASATRPWLHPQLALLTTLMFSQILEEWRHQYCKHHTELSNHVHHEWVPEW